MSPVHDELALHTPSHCLLCCAGQMAFGRSKGVGMGRAKKKTVVVEEQVPTADGTPLAAEEAPSSPAKVEKSAPRMPPPSSPGKQVRMEAGRVAREAAIRLRKLERRMPRASDAHEVAKRIYDSKKAKLVINKKRGASQKRGGSVQDAITRMTDLHICEVEWLTAQVVWFDAVGQYMTLEKDVADAELEVRDAKIAMLSRRVRALKTVRRNRKMGRVGRASQ